VPWLQLWMQRCRPKYCSMCTVHICNCLNFIMQASSSTHFRSFLVICYHKTTVCQIRYNSSLSLWNSSEGDSLPLSNVENADIVQCNNQMCPVIVHWLWRTIILIIGEWKWQFLTTTIREITQTGMCLYSILVSSTNQLN
jgi:hypothetical protein